MDGFQPLPVHMGVNLSGRDIGMTQQFLNHPQVGSTFEQVGGEGMPQQMGIHVLIDAGELGTFFHDLSNAVWREGSTTDTEENMG
jgi:hypothetical protein